MPVPCTSLVCPLHITCTSLAHHLHITCASLPCASLKRPLRITCRSLAPHLHIPCNSLVRQLRVPCTLNCCVQVHSGSKKETVFRRPKAGDTDTRFFNTVQPASSELSSDVQELVMSTQVLQHRPSCLFRVGDVDTSTCTLSILPLPNCLQTSKSWCCQHKYVNIVQPASSAKASNVHERVTQVRQHCSTCLFQTVFRPPRAGDVDTSTSTPPATTQRKQA